jgi:hypothetical protein
VSCAKVRYDSLPQASAALRTIFRDPASAEQEKIPRRAYFCRRCRGYHLTSQPISGSPEVTRLG